VTWESPLLACLAYLGFGLLALALPGVALQRLVRLKPDPALVLPLGFASCALLFWLSLVTGFAALFPLGLLGLGACSLLRPGPWARATGPSIRGALPPFLTLLGLLAVTQYPWNRVAADGSFLLDNLVPFDTAFHVGLARELALGYPPQMPGISGFPVGYHFGTDLVRAAALRWAHVDPWDSIARFDVTLGALALVLLARSLLWRLGASARAVALAPWTLLATDLSWAFAGNANAHWWTDLLRGNLLLSLALANPIVPALALLLGAFLALARYEAGEGRGQLVLAAGLGLAVPSFKVFLGAHMLVGLGAAAAWAFFRRKPFLPWLAVGIPCALATAALAFGRGSHTVVVAWAPLDLVAITRATLGLPALVGPQLLAWSVLWAAASLGIRLVGIPSALRRLRSGPGPWVALAAMALSGWPLGLAFRVSAERALPGQQVINDAAFLVEQSGPLLWLFAAVALGVPAWSRLRAAGLWALCALLSLPSTVQFVVRKGALPPDPIPAAMVRAMRALGTVAKPGEVVLQRPGARYPPLPVVLLGCRVPYERFTPYLTQFATVEDLEARHLLVYRFFRTTDSDEAIGIARNLGARYLALYGTDHLRCDLRGLAETIHDEPGARVYRLLVP
jgi:hypothetical protein